VHPLFALIPKLIILPILLIQLVLGEIGLIATDSVLAALLFAPIVAALTSLVLFDIAKKLQLPGTTALGIQLAFLLSFSTLVFGSLPDHYVLNGLYLSLLLRETLLPKQSTWRWLGFGVIGAGITITNIVPFFLVLTCSFQSQSHTLFIRKVWLAAKLSTAAMAITFIPIITLALTQQEVPVHATDQQSVNLGKWISHYLSDNLFEIVKRAAGFVMATADTFMTSNVLIYEFPAGTHRASLHYVPETPWPYAKALLLATTIASGSYFLYKQSQAAARLTLSALLIVCFHGGLFTLWGTEMFLYSQLWISCCLLLLCGNLVRLRERHANLAVALFLVAQTALNLPQTQLLLNQFG